MTNALLLTLALSLSLRAVAPAPPATLEVASYALIVASNRSADLSRPPLQYADDDGAKYQALFAAAVGSEHTILLTELDADTARLFPSLAAEARLPTRASLLGAAAEVARSAAEARQAGRRVRLYFVFAGHGDVEAGRGVLQLADGSFDSEDLATLLREVDADETHVLLDSCNSFFVVNPRKPGGRRFATPKAAAASLARRLPGVGVFLSTSAEAEVYEWSELQSGIFSHAVRSGLLGGADADGDGRITYEELAAFVETASADIKNPLFRPKVFARGPGGKPDQTLLDLSSFRGRSVLVDAGTPIRLAARDADGLRWLDVFAEAGRQVRLWIPAALVSRTELERLRPGGGPPIVEARYPVAAASGTGIIQASGWLPGAPGAGSRGADLVFRDLFRRPFGPDALVAWRNAKASEPEPVFGVSREDGDRMGRLLAQLAASEQERRTVRGVVAIIAGLGVAAFLAGEATDAPRDRRVALGAAAAGILALELGLGVHDLVTPSRGERIQRQFERALATPGADHSSAVAEADAGLHGVLEGEAAARSAPLVAGGVLLAFGVSLVAEPGELSEGSTRRSRSATRFAGALSLSVGASLLAGTWLADNPTEKIIAVWSREPSVKRGAELGVVPIPGGGLVALTGAF